MQTGGVGSAVPAYPLNPLSEPPVPEVQSIGNRPDVRVLVVDDDEAIREMLQAYFESCGYDVVTARDGDEALDLIDRSCDYDVVLLDVMMPGMTGVAVLRAMQEFGLTCPVVLMTAYGPLQKRIEALQIGAADLIAKPFTTHELDELMARVLQKT